MYRKGVIGYYLGFVVRLILEFRNILIILFAITALLLSWLSYKNSLVALKNTHVINARVETRLDINFPVRFFREESTEGSPNALEFRIKAEFSNSGQKVTLDSIKYNSNGRSYVTAILLETGTGREINLPITLESLKTKDIHILFKYYLNEDSPLYKLVNELYQPTDKKIKTLELINMLRDKQFYLVGELAPDGQYNPDKNPISFTFHIKEKNISIEKTLFIN